MSAVTVSVMFTDLVGSTEILTRVGEAQMEALRRELFSVLRDAASDHQGEEVKNLGDGLMFVFPSASDLVEGAVAVQQRLDQRNRRPGERLTVRVGLATGDADAADGDYFGEAVVEAARLCGAADGGQILATETVQLLSRQRTVHEFSSLGELSLKGFEKSTRVCEIHWTPLSVQQSAIPLSSRLQSGGLTEFVGRREQIERLTTALKDVSASGRQRVVLVSGEPGVGKTSLGAAFCRWVHEGQATVLYGRCDEDVRLPYQPWIEALEHLVAHIDEPVLRGHVEVHQGDLGSLVPALQARLGALPPPRSGDLDVSRHLFFEAVSDLLERAGSSTPLVVLLDDLHWADRSTLGLLRYLVAGEGSRPILIVGTFRDSEVGLGDPLSELLSQLHREERVERLSLRGLDDVELAELMSLAAGHELDDQGLALRDTLMEETSGNPFFASEILRHLAETGAIVPGADGRWQMARSAATTTLPVSVREVVSSRVLRLGQPAHRALAVASVIGREFQLDLLAEVAQVGDDELLDTLEQAASAGVLVELSGSDDRYAFAHSLTQRALYADLSAARRRRLHHRVAEALERRPEGLDDRAGDLAHHWAAATQPADFDKAIEWALRAGDRAIDQLAPDEAVRWYTQALDLCEGAADDAVRASCLVRLGGAQRWAQLPDYRATLLEGGRLAHTIGDMSLVAEAALSNFRGFFSNAGTADLERIAMLELALGAVGEDQPSLRARLLARLAVECFFLPDRDTGAILDQALSLTADRGDPVARIEVLVALCTYYVPENLERRERAVGELRDLAEGETDPIRRLWALWSSVPVLAQRGEIEALRELTHGLRQAADRLGDGGMRWFASLNDQMLALFAGDLETAERLNTTTLELGVAAGQPDAIVVAGAVQSFISLMRGAIDESMRQVLEEVSTTRPEMVVAKALLAEAEARGGRPEACNALLDELVGGGFLERPRDPLWAAAVDVMAEAAASTGHEPALRPLRRAAEVLRGQVVYTGATIHGSGELIAARTSAALGLWDEAEADWAAALDRSRTLGEQHTVATIGLEWAQMLARRRLTPDLERARRLAEDARALAAARGYLRIREEAADLLAELGAV